MRLVLATALAWLAGCGGTKELVNPLEAPLPSPKEEVLLDIDDLGVSHVYAKSDEDAFFGAGYAMARDRLFQMELARRRALGTTAEVFGGASLTDDIGARALGFGRLGEADAARVAAEEPEQAKLVEAWCSGVNRRIVQIDRGEIEPPYGLGSSELGFVPEPWTPAHAYAIGKVLAFGLSDTLEADVLATAFLHLVPDVIAHLPLQMPAYDVYTLGGPGQSGAPAPKSAQAPWTGFDPARFSFRPMFAPLGSNNWAVDGAHTDSGRPLLAGDPHQELTSPTRLWPLHMSTVEAGGTLDVIGFAFVGTPTVQLGHNAHVGWTATTNFADVMDLLDVQVDDAFTSAMVGGEARAITTRQEKIAVRVTDAPFGTTETNDLAVHEVEGLGVILPEEVLPIPKSFLAQGDLLFMWTGFRPTAESAAYVAIDRAEDLDAFEAAVGRLEVGAVNFVAADAGGIGYHVHARVPDRGDPASRPMPWHVVDGADPASLWTRGDLPSSKLPHWRDPARGFLVTANNDPFGFTADGDVENDPFYYGGLYDGGLRAHRVEEALGALLGSGKKVGRADMEELQRDVHSPMADTLLPHLAEAMDHLADDPDLAPYVARDDLALLAAKLAAWDRRFVRDRGEPVVFLAFEWFAARRVLQKPITALLFDAVAEQRPAFFMAALRNVVEGRFPDAAMFTGGNLRLVMLQALDETSVWLDARFGSVDPGAFSLSDVHAAEFLTKFGGDLTVPRVAVDGSLDTVSVSSAAFLVGGKPLDELSSSLMPLYRMVIGFAEDGTPEATVDFARGTSEDPKSPHFADQEPAWAAATHAALPFRKADVEARTTERYAISPEAKTP